MTRFDLFRTVNLWLAPKSTSPHSQKRAGRNQRQAKASPTILASAVYLCMVLISPVAYSQEQATPANRKISAGELASWINSEFRQAWKQQGIEPAAPTNDSEFVRRAFLDLIGRIPSVAEASLFLEDPSPEKRRHLIEELLQRGAFANHLANTWRDLMLAGSAAQDARGLAPSLEIWLKLRFTANMPYDQIVTELLTAPLDQATSPRAQSPRTPSPLAFYQAAEFKPEQLTANASRVFMGIQVQCAQCHDHPFAEWKQPQFWSFAAFFKDAETQRNDGTTMMASDDSDEIKIPGKDVLVPALFLDGSKPVRQSNESKRLVLARWITSPENPYFAKAAVNRIWGSFLGHGFVQPVDDLDPSHPPIYPEIFNALSDQFRLHQYDLKYLVRVITSTEVYQLSCRGAPHEDDPLAQHFARMPLRRMTSDQIYASFIQATGYRDAAATPAVLGGDMGARDDFLDKFADSSVSPTEIKTTILQALSLMNGRYVTSATNIENSEFLSVISEAPYLDTAGRIEALFMAALSRPPDEAELKMYSAALGAEGSTESKAALADLFWILLNSAEFLLNH